MTDKNMPVRKNVRWEKQDYSQPAEYAITICVKDNKQILSRVVPIYELKDVSLLSCKSDQTVGAGVLDRPYSAQIILTPYGKIAEKYIKQLDAFYKNIQVLKYVIMPSHIHLLIRILYDDEYGRSGTPVPTNDAVTESENHIINCDDNNGANSLISKFISTFKRFCNKEYGENIWQSRYHDHVIRGEQDYREIWQYIDNNPQKWALDRYYTE